MVEEKFKNLKEFNLIMAGLHFVQGVLVLLLSKDFKLPVTTNYLTYDTMIQALVPMTQALFNLPLAYLIAGFLFLSALAHLIIATVYNKTYNANLAKGINKARWIEYAFSASTMMVAIAMLVGIYDLGTLIAIFVLVAIMNLLGLVMEVHNQTTQKTNWLSYYIGCLAGVVPWVIVGIFFWAANTYGSGDIPTYVYWIYISIFLAFNCYAVNMVLQYKKVGKWRDYLYRARAYIILSLVAKSALAWQVFAGTLRP
jgi:VanZ family protein